MNINWNVVTSVLVAMLIFKIADVMFIDKQVSKLTSNYEDDYED